MANKFTRYLGSFLGGVANGLTNPKGLVSNWRHATRLFVDDTMRLAPKHKFNYYVRFDVDPSASKAPGFSTKHVEETGLLVKTCDLPKFSFQSQTLNQYNRKKIVYTNFTYDPINITMHDDNNGIINALWAVYYGYYIKDRNLPPAAFEPSSMYRYTNTPLDSARYGLDNSMSVPFFRSIDIYTMGRRRFIGYHLINPRIISWQHGNRDHSASEPAESSMTIEYEAVTYSAGTVSIGNPKGFANLHYDVTPSPLSVAGGGISALLGEGGVLDGIEQVFGSVADGSMFDSPGSFLGTVAKGINTYRNAKNLSKEGLLREGLNVLSSPGALTTTLGGIAGVAGAVFPKNDPQNTPTQGSQKSVVNELRWDDNLGDFI